MILLNKQWNEQDMSNFFNTNLDDSDFLSAESAFYDIYVVTINVFLIILPIDGLFFYHSSTVYW